jgi:pimeloyl-ACP methyl ester carboxylesterase
MDRLRTDKGTTISYERHGSGPALVLVHGGFSDHRTNWEFVLPMLEQRFTVYAIARRGRGETDATAGHRLEDEAQDTAAVIESIGEPVFLLGHSYGAHTALAAAALVPDRVRKLVLYEAPWPQMMNQDKFNYLSRYAQAGDWDRFATSFFHEMLYVPMEELEALRRTELWAPIIADAPASLGDLSALSRYAFDPDRFRHLQMPVLLQIGSESPRHLFVTDTMAALLPDARVATLEGQAHEGMTTAPELYAESTVRFLLGQAWRESQFMSVTGVARFG